MLFCSALKHRNIFDQPNLSFARCTTLWEWDHPSFSQPIRLNFSFCNVLYYTKMHSVVHSLSFLSFFRWWRLQCAAWVFVWRMLAPLQIVCVSGISASAVLCSSAALSAPHCRSQAFFPPFFSSCMTLFCLGPQVNLAIFCPLVHASHINLESIESRCTLTCYKNISVCVIHQGFSTWLACIPALMNPEKTAESVKLT